MSLRVQKSSIFQFLLRSIGIYYTCHRFHRKELIDELMDGHIEQVVLACGEGGRFVAVVPGGGIGATGLRVRLIRKRG